MQRHTFSTQEVEYHERRNPKLRKMGQLKMLEMKPRRELGSMSIIDGEGIVDVPSSLEVFTFD